MSPRAGRPPGCRRAGPKWWWTALWAAGLCLALGAAVEGGDALARVQARLGEPAVVRGKFTQRKHVAGGVKPLVSTGDFLAAKGRGVIWRTRAPLEGTLWLTPAEIRHEAPDRPPVRFPADRDPALRALTSTVFALMSADFRVLQDAFRLVTRIEEDGRWQVLLHPLGGTAAHFRLIRLEGEAQVQRVEIHASGGDRTDIRFQDVQTADTLAPEEAGLLE
jgi:hypothetical protein